MAPFRSQQTGRRSQRAIGGLVPGGLLLVVYFHLVGIEEVRRVLWTVPPRRILSLLIVGGVPLVFWGLGLHPVLGRLGVSIRLFDSILLYAASGFPNAITPFGQVVVIPSVRCCSGGRSGPTSRSDWSRSGA
jgi:uncharacterized membrane protein YbhN (UPF0104 family)